MDSLLIQDCIPNLWMDLAARAMQHDDIDNWLDIAPLQFIAYFLDEGMPNDS